VRYYEQIKKIGDRGLFGEKQQLIFFMRRSPSYILSILPEAVTLCFESIAVPQDLHPPLFALQEEVKLPSNGVRKLALDRAVSSGDFVETSIQLVAKLGLRSRYPDGDQGCSLGRMLCSFCK
jgi:hypothetical protein